jgi:ADP-ribose pyrophosphatase YjhB (NUDIX family)
MQTQFDPAEEQALIARYGPTAQDLRRFGLDAAGYAYWWQATALLRRAEVVLIVQRPDGRLLLHTKGHYPPGTYRLPTGGVQWGEPVLDALAREQGEELSARLPVVALPALIRYELVHEARSLPFASYLFLLQAPEGFAPAANDPREAISAYRWVAPAEMGAVADHLRGIVRSWGNWGDFRAITHEVLAELRGGQQAD